ncbi:hypothetical protein RRG08_065231 [Elysia crispata]|uniref:Uncharacterized protein n=1 Tax=Elysia crispata TaxID=231223 RepID=A0AAE1CZL0_9GAST|nr:hypothetical protein RRG08_065231 [Elysia crispata]
MARLWMSDRCDVGFISWSTPLSIFIAQRRAVSGSSDLCFHLRGVFDLMLTSSSHFVARATADVWDLLLRVDRSGVPWSTAMLWNEMVRSHHTSLHETTKPTCYDDQGLVSRHHLGMNPLILFKHRHYQFYLHLSFSDFSLHMIK